MTRDSEALATGPLPTLCRGTSPVLSKGRLHSYEVGGDVVLDGVLVKTGDLIAIDADGLACISPGREADVFKKAIEILTAEERRDVEFRQQIQASHR